MGFSLLIGSADTPSPFCSTVFQKEVQALLLSGGEDYEIAFTAPERQTEKITKIAEKLEIPCTKIGKIKVGSDVSVYDEKGSEIIISNMGFDHFKV